jgi:hypothetical protein
MRRGGRRPQGITAADAAVSCAGRWGRRRARVDECWATLTAERVYDRLLCDGAPIAPGWRGVLTWTPGPSTGRAWGVTAEVLDNAVWRFGRLFLRCPRCQKRVTRVYLPTASTDPRCRRCWGLSYESRSWSYAPTGLWGPLLGPVAYATTSVRREERLAVSQARYAARRARRVPG